ncbi:TetR/AcrR family transcriptional regulator [Glaciibacter sp. 2TAF33]|uniref:TetR/AcrR family transcriptional regulator n=1 Tax=Glaciibacter sp. 2TAF33 TaxID=3233015 RepID=UPI003F90F73E
MPAVSSASARSRRARNSLTFEGILNAGEQVAATGFDALTIRAVATELESSPMSLYRYFGTKGELVDALLNRVLGRFAHPLEDGPWIEALRRFAVNHRTLLLDHPWAIAPLIANPYPGPNALPIGETALRILDRGNIRGDDAVAVFSGIVALNYGWSSFVVARSGSGGVQAVRDVARGQASPDYPFTGRVAEPLSRFGSDDHYASILDQLLVGVAAASPTRQL